MTGVPSAVPESAFTPAVDKANRLPPRRPRGAAAAGDRLPVFPYFVVLDKDDGRSSVLCELLHLRLDRLEFRICTEIEQHYSPRLCFVSKLSSLQRPGNIFGRDRKNDQVLAVADFVREIAAEFHAFKHAPSADTDRLDITWLAVETRLARGLQTELHELRPDIPLGRCMLPRASAPASLHCVTREKIHLRTDTSFIDDRLLQRRSGERYRK